MNTGTTKTGIFTKLTIAFGAGIYGLISLNQSFAESPGSNEDGIAVPVPVMDAPGTAEYKNMEDQGRSNPSYVCDVFIDPDQRVDCLSKQGDVDLESESGNRSISERDLARQKQNRAVLNQLYKNIYLYNSGVFNYEKKIK